MSGCNTASLANLTKCLTGVTKGAATDAFSAIAGAFGKAADNTINWLWAQMSSATAIRLGGTAFHQLLAVALAVAAVVAVGIFVAQLAVSAVRRDPGGAQPVGGRPVRHGPRGGRGRRHHPAVCSTPSTPCRPVSSR